MIRFSRRKKEIVGTVKKVEENAKKDLTSKIYELLCK
jgi:hypothetical protein